MTAAELTPLDQITVAIRNAAVQIVQSSGELTPLDQIAVAIQTLLETSEDNLFNELEQLIVGQAFRHSRYNQVHAASALGISRNSLRTLLKKHGYLDNGIFDSSKVRVPAHGNVAEL